ncbi:hypothetical protein [Streptomyces harbinensis]|uniref:hypothetical protein n=1 Tax=Streptomyces harbinensis TaxID=1176198 RepID=UPI0036C5BF94
MSDDGLGAELRALRQHLEPGVAPAGPAEVRRRGERRRARRRTAAVTLSVGLVAAIGLGGWALAPRPGGEPVPPAAADPSPPDTAPSATPLPALPPAALPGVWRGWEWRPAAQTDAAESRLMGFTTDQDCGWPLTGEQLGAGNGASTFYTEELGGAWSSYEVMEFADEARAAEAFTRLQGNREYCTLFPSGASVPAPVPLVDGTDVVLYQQAMEAEGAYEAALVVAWRGERVAVLRTLLSVGSPTDQRMDDADRTPGGVPSLPLDGEATPHDCLAVLVADGVAFAEEDWTCPAED